MVIVVFSHCHVQVQLCNDELLCIQDSVACAYVSQLSPPMTGKLYRKTAVRPPTNQRRASPRDVIAILIADSRDSTRPINVSCLHCLRITMISTELGNTPRRIRFPFPGKLRTVNLHDFIKIIE